MWWLWKLMIKHWIKVALVGVVVFISAIGGMMGGGKRINNTGDIYEAPEGYSTGIGCATGRQFLGWAYRK